MNLYLHLLIHLSFGFLAGIIVFRLWKKPGASIMAGLAGGFLVDLDHLIDYFLAFGTNLKLDYFLSGYQFLKSDKIYIFFHAWEYGIVLIGLGFLVKNKIAKSILFGAALGLLFHLALDVALNEMPPKSYSIAYRLKNNFSLEYLVYPDHWSDHEKRKKEIILP